MQHPHPIFSLPLLIALSTFCWADEQPFESLIRVNKTIVQSTGGVCLDGTPPGYYLRQPKNASVRSWRVHFRGGGWCFTERDCWLRSKTNLGTSALWPDKIEDAAFGFLSSDSTLNPGFADWGAVFIEYCDGSSYTSDRDDPLQVNGDVIYLRGRRVLQAVLLDLEERVKLLSNADAVVFSGTSAGGLATFLHADYLAHLFPSNVRVNFFPDAGVFLDHKRAMSNINAFRDDVINGLNLWNATVSLNPLCLDEWSPENKSWHCFFVKSVFRHFTTKRQFFVLNSMYDLANIKMILQLPCDPPTPGSCSPDQLQTFQGYRDSMRDALTELCADGLQSVFASSCYQHEESCQNADWTQMTVNNMTLQQAVASWYFDGKSIINFDNLSWPENVSCVKNITHGPC